MFVLSRLALFFISDGGGLTEKPHALRDRREDSWVRGSLRERWVGVRGQSPHQPSGKEERTGDRSPFRQ